MDKTLEHVDAPAKLASPKREPMYKLSAVEKTYKQKNRSVKALDGVELEIMPGEMVAIQGTTGGGKSTLLQMLGALDRPTAGSVHLAGRDLTTLGDKALADIRANEIGFVFQHYNLIPTLSAQENVEMGLAPQKLPGTERARLALAALESVGLAERASHLPGELSGGQQQRVAIARALAKKPRVLLADEPTGNLDEKTRDEIMDLFGGLWKEGLTIVMVTHDTSVARRAGRRLRISSGRVSEVV